VRDEDPIYLLSGPLTANNLRDLRLVACVLLDGPLWTGPSHLYRIGPLSGVFPAQPPEPRY
jgi:hypothetical protein